ncbi:MAG: molecular chaperone TorD family protein [Planctomycetaceae bacterium]|nr:molecular chaperone TorD family protein [Planctomycetales bacterium]MCB9941734.1 molecular chaperone TorD family protein [Planctomycetaceae bacterium]
MQVQPTSTIQFDPALNFARQSLYRFAALSLLDPQAGSWEQLNALQEDQLLAEAAEIIRALPKAKPDSLGMGERGIEHLQPAAVFDKLPPSASELNAEYERTFGLLVANGCPPYETEYINGKFTFQRSNALADVSGFYRAFGVLPSAQRPERHDHIVLELEFMAFLVGLERQAAEAATSEQEERLEVCSAAQERFCREHLAWWVPAFAKLLGKEYPSGFYAAIGVFLSAWIPAERAMLGIEVSNTPVAPTANEVPEECEGCGLST